MVRHLARAPWPYRECDAKAFAARSDSACIPVLAELSTVEDFYLRWRAAGLLENRPPPGRTDLSDEDDDEEGGAGQPELFEE